MVKVPKQLQNKEFEFVLLGKWNLWGRYENKKGKSVMVDTKEFPAHEYDILNKEKSWKPLGKAPFESAWQKKGYKSDNPILLKHDTNFGIIGGYGNLVILDIDDVKLGERFEKELDTFTIKTGSGGRHFYFIVKEEIANKVLINGLGELRANNYQVVCSPSRHPNGQPYNIHIDKPIKKITEKELLEKINPYLKKETTLTTPIKDYESKDTSRSGLEFRKVMALVSQGLSKEKVFKEMMAYSKWATSPDAYKEKTYEKAQDVLRIQEKVEDENSDLDVISHKDLMNYEPKPQKWLIEDQIPENEIGMLVGKRGDRKTFTALFQSLCVASASKCFDDGVPEKKKVLFITEEDSIDTLVSRIKPMIKGLEIKEPESLEIKYMSFNGLKLDRKDKKFEKFKKLIEEYQPHLIFIDALQRCVTFNIDKENSLISELFTDTIRPLQKKWGGTWLFISHLRKSPTMKYTADDPLDEVRGGSELVNYCRFVLLCQTPKYQTQSQDDSEMVVFRVIKMSGSKMAEPKAVSYTTTEDGSIKVVYEGLPSEVLAGEIQCAEAIKEWLVMKNMTEEFRTKDIKEASEEIGFKNTLLSAGLNVLVKNNFLMKIKRGTYKVKSQEVQQKKLVKTKEVKKEELSDKEIEKMMEDFE